MAARSATGKGAKKPSSKGDKTPAQLRKDPAFMRRVEAAIGDEYRKAAEGAPRADTAPAEKPAAGPQKARRDASAPAAAPAPERPRAKARPKARPKAAGKKALAAELCALVPELDEEGLAFLIEQARVHLYNMRVAELEEAGARLEESASRSRSAAGAAKAQASGAGFSVKASEDGSDYHIVYNGKWKLFSGSEMLALVKIATVKDPPAEVGGRLYRWLKAERSDFFADVPVSGPADPLMAALVGLIRKTFVVKR